MMQQAVENDRVTGHDAVSKTCKARKKGGINHPMRVAGCLYKDVVSIYQKQVFSLWGQVIHPSSRTIHDPCTGDLRINCL